MKVIVTIEEKHGNRNKEENISAHNKISKWKVKHTTHDLIRRNLSKNLANSRNEIWIKKITFSESEQYFSNSNPEKIVDG